VPDPEPAPDWPEGWTFRVERDRIEVTSNLPRPDPNWQHTDQAGHQHHREDNAYPTLRAVDEPTYWCADCGDDHTRSRYECRICGETITPGLVGPSAFREFIPGMASYWLNDQPITEDRYLELIATYRLDKP
jgi:hypothetical protein